MRPSTPYQTLKIVGYGVIALCAAAVCYAGYISITYWTGIGV